MNEPNHSLGSNPTNVIVLLSGGIDSMACLYYYLSQNFKVRCLFVDYGQPVAKRELQSARDVADHFVVDLDQVECHFGNTFNCGEIRGRNAFLIFSALMKYPTFSGILSLGIHAGTPYYDCGESFVQNIKPLVKQCTAGQVSLDFPFLEWSKPKILNYCEENNLPLKLTYSCEVSPESPCRKCNSCLDRIALNAS